MKGLVHIYTGDGKGKTTAAIGLGVRACGNGLKVLMVQFLKSMPSGEILSLKKLEPDFKVLRGINTKKFTSQMNEDERAQAAAEQKRLFESGCAEALQGKVDLLILDEILGAVSSGMLSVKSIVDFIKARPAYVELVLTGRDAPKELVELADYVSDIDNVKHPAKKGVKARKGIEF